MKVKYFFFFFLSISSFVAFGQTSVTMSPKSDVSGYKGLIYDSSQPTAYQYITQAVRWELGNYFNNNSNYNINGRGYLEFDLQDIPSNATITVADLKMYVGFTTKTSESFIVRILPSAISVIGGYGTYTEYSSYAGGSSISTITDVRFGDTKTLSLITQVSAKKGNTLYLGLIHSNENSSSYGLYLHDVKLEITYTVPVTKPNAPSNLQYSNLATNGCKLTWSAPSGGGAPDGYRVYNGSTKIGSDLSSSTTSTTITTLSPSTSYTLCVKAFNAGGESSCSNTVTFTTLSIPVISGSSLICYGSNYNFSATNWVSGYSFDSSTNISLSGLSVSGSNASVTVSTNGVGQGYVYVKNSSGTTLTEYKVWIGIPAYSFSGPTASVVGAMNKFTLNVSGSYSFSTQWSASNFHEMYWPTNTMVDIIFSNQNSQHWVRADVTNSCGTTPYYYHFVDVDCVRTSCPHPPTCPCISVIWSPPSPYPNPASDIINIEIDAEAIAQNKDFEQNLTDDQPIKLNATFDVRLYDGQGNLLQQQKTKGGTVQFKVSNLPDGFYYLHIYDGVSSTPEIHQIIVEH